MMRLLTNRWLHTGLLLTLLAGALFVRVQDNDVVKSLRFAAFDAYNRIHERPAQSDVVIVDLDEVSMRDDKMGQWPWPRTAVAQLVSNLKQMGARAIVFDMVFAEEDRTSPAVVARRLPKDQNEVRAALAELPGHDEILAASFGDAGNVVTGFVWSNRKEATRHNPVLSRPILFRKGSETVALHAQRMTGVTTNLEILERAAAGNGSFGVIPEVDGIIRKVPLFFRQGDAKGKTAVIYPSLALEALRVAQDPRLSYSVRRLKSEELSPFAPEYELTVGAYKIPLDADGFFRVHFSRARPDRYIPAWQVMESALDPALIKDKIVLVGTSAEGLKDIRSTPLDLFIPGVELHLNIIEQVLQGRYLLRPQLMLGAECLFILAVGLAIIVLAPFVNAIFLAFVTAAMTGGITLASYYAYTVQGLLLDPAYPALTIIVISVAAAFLTYLRAESERRAVRQAFGLYISPEYMKELTEHPEQLRLGGEQREISVMFTDIRGFTGISEQLAPDELIQLMNEFLTPMSDLVMAHRGTIDKYMGDAMMAFWNAPLDDPDHARHACQTALAMNQALEPLNAQLAAKAAEEGRAALTLKAGIGVNSGPGAVGNMGSRQRFAYSVLGDTVNLASRLEGQTKTYGVDILIGPETYAQVADFAALELDLIRVKGRQVPARIYTLLGDDAIARTEEFVRLRQAHDAMLAFYRAGEFAQAQAQLENCRDLAVPGVRGYYDMMDTRLRELQASPPGVDWDGVYSAASK